MALFLSGLFVGRPIPPSQRSHGDRKISPEDKEPEGLRGENDPYLCDRERRAFRGNGSQVRIGSH